MNTNYSCPHCGIVHPLSLWVEHTENVWSILSEFGAYFCPECERLTYHKALIKVSNFESLEDSKLSFELPSDQSTEESPSKIALSAGNS